MSAIQRQLDFSDEQPMWRTFASQLENFTFNGEQTKVAHRNGVPYLYNEFWTARQRQGHSLHEISYRACFKAELPEFFISRLTGEGDTVYDPFMGRGTTPLQAALMNRKAIGNDVNPLSPMLCRPRFSSPTLAEIALRLDEIPKYYPVSDDDPLLVFYHADTLGEILALRHYLLDRDAKGLLDPVDDWIRMVAINRLTGHSSGFFSVYSLPPNQAVSIDSQRKINAKRKQTPPKRDTHGIILKKSRSLLKEGGPKAASVKLTTGSAHLSPQIESDSIDLVVTSPPFLNIVQYAADNWLRCWFADIDIKEVDVAMHRKPDQWQNFTRSVLIELSRVVRSGGVIAYEVGEVRGGEIELDQLVLAAAHGLPLTPECVVVNIQEFTKTANCWGVDNNTKGTNSNRIVILRRN